jgi:hypothetical protein
MPGKFKNAMKTAGRVLDAYAERDKKVKDLAKTLQFYTYGVDYDQARKIAEVLIDRAEITWK